MDDNAEQLKAIERLTSAVEEMNCCIRDLTEAIAGASVDSSWKITEQFITTDDEECCWWLNRQEE